MFKRALKLPSGERSNSFFIWGPRQTGKSTLLKQNYANAIWVDLLNSEAFRRYTERPELLRLELEKNKPGSWVVIDEIQFVPALLNEVHWLIENRHLHFALSGSSARKLKRGAANLLGGRAHRYELGGLTSEELRKDFDLIKILNRGYLPRHYLDDQFLSLQSSYVSDYLKEEIFDEGLVRKLPVFSRFLNFAALSDTEFVNASTIARECGVSSHTIKGYFQILEDTLIGRWLPPFTRRPKRRVSSSSKFYFFDVGVVNFLTKRRNLEPGSELFGKALENFVFHELRTYNEYRSRFADLYYWRLTSGSEVDFVVNDMEAAIEVKSSEKIRSHHLKGLRELKKEHKKVKNRILVCLDSKAWKTEDDIQVVPIDVFLHNLWKDEYF